MRKALLFATVLAAAACHRPGIQPVAPEGARTLEPEVRALIEDKLRHARDEPADGRAHAALALAYEANELWGEAVRSFENAIALDDGRPLWRYHHGIALREMGRVQDAIAVLREAARRLPSEAAVHQRLGHFLLQIGEIDAARASFERESAAAAGRAEPSADMAALELAREDWNAALEDARRALAIDPTLLFAAYAAGRALQGLGREEEARPFLAAGLDARPRWLWDPLSAEVHALRLTTNGLIEKARAAFSGGDYAHAAKLYETIVARKPEDPEVLNNMAACLLELGRLDRAEQILGATLRLAPDSFVAHLNLAELHSKRGEIELARGHADRAAKLAPDVARTRFVLGRILARQDELDAAATELEAANRIEPRNAECVLLLAEVAIRRKRSDEARAWCRRALEIDPSLLAARVHLGVLALQAGDVAEARSTLDVLERTAPTHPSTVALRKSLGKLGH